MHICDLLKHDYPSIEEFKNETPQKQYNYLSNILIAAVYDQKNPTKLLNNSELKNSISKSFKEVKIVPPWWSEECIELVKSRRIASNNFLRQPSPENLKIYEKI